MRAYFICDWFIPCRPDKRGLPMQPTDAAHRIHPGSSRDYLIPEYVFTPVCFLCQMNFFGHLLPAAVPRIPDQVSVVISIRRDHYRIFIAGSPFWSEVAIEILDVAGRVSSLT